MSVDSNISKIATVVVGDPKAPFSIATRVGEKQFISMYCPTLPLIRTLKFWVLIKAASSTIFFGLWYDDLWFNPGLPGHWRTHTLSLSLSFSLPLSLSPYIYIYIYICVYLERERGNQRILYCIMIMRLLIYTYLEKLTDYIDAKKW